MVETTTLLGICQGNQLRNQGFLGASGGWMIPQSKYQLPMVSAMLSFRGALDGFRETSTVFQGEWTPKTYP